MFQILNVFFHVTHLLIISFILIGWAFKKTRKPHLILVVLTIFSWIGLGFFYGWGYCFWTDWHWSVRDHLGLSHPASYLKLLADTVTNRNWNAGMIDALTAAIFLVVIVLTVIVNVRQSSRGNA
jgi:hypothetical protein